MKICCKLVLWLRNSKQPSWLKFSLAVLAWICCCYQGDEARAIQVLHVKPMTFECNVILAGTLARTIMSSCNCKCGIWCRNSGMCKEWSSYIQGVLLHPSGSKQADFLEILATTCTSCCKPVYIPAASQNKHTRSLDIQCNESRSLPHHSNCDIHPDDTWCCSIYCSGQTDQESCSYFSPNISSTDKNSSGDRKTFRSKNNVHSKETPNERHKRESGFQEPYHFEALETFNEIVVLQLFNITVRLVDKRGLVVTNTRREAYLSCKDTSNQGGGTDCLVGVLKTALVDGYGIFTNVSFVETGDSYHLTITSSGSPGILPWISDSISVTFRPLTLRSSGRTLPISPRENETLSPAAGVIVYDVIDDAPANGKYLSRYTWEGSIGLLYDDIYPGELLGTTTQILEYGANEIIFSDVIITDWGYSYILRITMKALETNHWKLTYLIGPFDVDMMDTFDLPLVQYSEYRQVRVAFDGDFERVQEDERKFTIFFLNCFGKRYPNVRWQNVTISEGSVVVDAVITGLTEELERTSKELDEDIENGRADIQYEENRVWKARSAFLPSRKLLEESENTQGQNGDEGAGGLSVAWIVAIVVNVVLILAFIITVIYCYCRRKRAKSDTHTGSTVRHFDGQPDPLVFANKAENKKSLEEKSALIDSGPRNTAIFTVEEGRQRYGNHTSHSRSHEDNDKCNCFSPTCYCSVGDGRKTETSFHQSVEENEDDPQGYPTPSPEPTFPTPEPSPEPDEYWRPDSFQKQDEEEEEEEEEEMFLPGAVSEPEPEPPQKERYYVYHVTDIDGSRELVGSLYLPVDSFLNDVRREIDRDRDLSEVIEGREYRFLDENMEVIPNYQESSLDLERIFPADGINVQFVPKREEKPKTPEPPVFKRQKPPAYVGPLGICNAADCMRAAKIKCLDCRNVAYCTKRCMRLDAKDHRRVCFKPAWRI